MAILSIKKHLFLLSSSSTNDSDVVNVMVRAFPLVRTLCLVPATHTKKGTPGKVRVH